MNHRIAFLVSLFAAACAAPLADPDGDLLDAWDAPKDDSSVEATFVDFHFRGRLVIDGAWDVTRIETQLLYTIGQLNAHRSVGRLDQLRLSNVEVHDGVVAYDAALPVAWGLRDEVPEKLELTLPRDVSTAAQETFAERYGSSCVGPFAHDVDAGSIWYYFRPSRCTLRDEDVFRVEVTVTPSVLESTGNYPEYDRIWEDGELRVLAVFGKNEVGGGTWDVGVRSYRDFLERVRADFEPYDLKETALDGGFTFEATLDGAHRIQMMVLLVDEVSTADEDFDALYEEASTRADLIIYNGHSGLGQNVRALASKGRWAAGQYSIVFLNGCDTYAYVDSTLRDDRAALNPDDHAGTKYLDVVTNAMPAYFSDGVDSTVLMIDGLMSYDEPRTYEEIFARIAARQVVIVSGEQDNEFGAL